ncbi:hypothetical protein [Streptomyces soliscabiei]|uniref:hypothetical protein n=1 Tax=Streptomyces soliscabiei TaxID=588897 RepID=UPI0029B8EF36|nr:hypothetical protein [Streptomyces sp. NY05-11A]MDX2676725.1 hypothetical protein [Streptomyces sp. NY05-11A]
MTAFTRAELESAFSTWHRTVRECARTHDWAPFVALFTEKAEYHEANAGVLVGPEQIAGWIDFAMGQFPGTEYEEFPVHWHVIDEQAGVIVAKVGNLMRDPGDGWRLETTNLLVLEYAGGGRFSREEDVYDPAVFIGQVQEWGKRAVASGTLTDEQRAWFAQSG